MLIALFLAAATGAGPDLEERAAPVDLPIHDVMVFSDRARVMRRGHVKWSGGVVRAPDLPGAALLDTVRVSADGARVVRVETRPVERERWSIDQVDQWLAQLETVGDKIAVAQGKLQAARNELGLLANLNAAPPVLEKDRLGKPTPELAPDNWRVVLDHLAQRRAQARVVEKQLEKDLTALNRDYEKARREVQKRDVGGFSDHKVEVLVILESDKPEGELSVEYAVPGASWHPAYDLMFDPDGGKVTLSASGLVSQATGEDWSDTKLALSTAIPGQGIAMPELNTWTLGDDREWLPRYSARTPPRTTRPFQPPAARPRLADIEKDAERAVLNDRSALLRTLLASNAHERQQPVTTAMPSGGGKNAEGYDFDGDAIEGSLSAPDAAEMPSPPPPPPPQPKPTVQMSSKHIETRTTSDERAPMAAPEEEAGEMDAPVATGSVAHISSRESMNYRGMQLQASLGWTRPYFSDQTLPAVTAGGFDYVYDAPVTTSVPSQADHLRVPLATRSYDVSTFYEATPSLATTAYLKATVKNGSQLPILAGPANVFVKGAFAGDANLMTTGPGGVLELPLGA
ncbi:MAG TPA: mucoidy inhibitor MuiA family protein, partial [Myxococcota bacterium]